MAEVTITLKPGGRDSYYSVTCNCGWSESLRNSDITARDIAKRYADEHLYCHREGVPYRIRGKLITPPKEAVQ